MNVMVYKIGWIKMYVFFNGIWYALTIVSTNHSSDCCWTTIGPLPIWAGDCFGPTVDKCCQELKTAYVVVDYKEKSIFIIDS